MVGPLKKDAPRVNLGPSQDLPQSSAPLRPDFAIFPEPETGAPSWGFRACPFSGFPRDSLKG